MTRSGRGVSRPGPVVVASGVRRSEPVGGASRLCGTAVTQLVYARGASPVVASRCCCVCAVRGAAAAPPSVLFVGDNRHTAKQTPNRQSAITSWISNYFRSRPAHPARPRPSLRAVLIRSL